LTLDGVLERGNDLSRQNDWYSEYLKDSIKRTDNLTAKACNSIITRTNPIKSRRRHADRHSTNPIKDDNDLNISMENKTEGHLKLLVTKAQDHLIGSQERAYDKAVRLWSKMKIPYLTGTNPNSYNTVKGMDCSGMINATLFGEGVRKFTALDGNWPVKGWHYVGKGIKIAQQKDILLWTISSGNRLNHFAFYAGPNLLFHANVSKGVSFTHDIDYYWMAQGEPKVYREDGY